MMTFKNREHAAYLLAAKLQKYKGKNPLVLAIPRGAVPMAQIIADALEGEMDVVLVHKLRAPFQPELAIGSVDETGHVYLGRHATAIGISEEYLKQEKESQVTALRERRELYTPVRPPISPAHRIVIIVDDGIATGASMIAAVHAVKAEKAAKVVVATAVAPFESVESIRGLADDVVCLLVPEDFYAVGQFFEEFNQVSDEEVIEILQKSRQKPSEKKS